jgi:hypothetical protein
VRLIATSLFMRVLSIFSRTPLWLDGILTLSGCQDRPLLAVQIGCGRQTAFSEVRRAKPACCRG